MLTQKTAKELTLGVWRYLEEHPGRRPKARSAGRIVEQENEPKDWGPLCDLLMSEGAYCGLCPLFKAEGKDCGDSGSAYKDWEQAQTNSDRERSAGRIVTILSAWEPEEDDEEE
jgi:hypothetical protein